MTRAKASKNPDVDFPDLSHAGRRVIVYGDCDDNPRAKRIFSGYLVSRPGPFHVVVKGTGSQTGIEKRFETGAYGDFEYPENKRLAILVYRAIEVPLRVRKGSREPRAEMNPLESWSNIISKSGRLSEERNEADLVLLRKNVKAFSLSKASSSELVEILDTHPRNHHRPAFVKVYRESIDRIKAEIKRRLAE